MFRWVTPGTPNTSGMSGDHVVQYVRQCQTEPSPASVALNPSTARRRCRWETSAYPKGDRAPNVSGQTSCSLRQTSVVPKRDWSPHPATIGCRRYEVRSTPKAAPGVSKNTPSGYTMRRCSMTSVAPNLSVLKCGVYTRRYLYAACVVPNTSESRPATGT